MLDRIYTGRIVPEGIGGSSLDQRRIPHPSREQDGKSVKQAARDRIIHWQRFFRFILQIRYYHF
jgi:hypothetical protein